MPRPSRAAKAEAKAANPGEGLTMENNQLSPEETAKVIAKLKEAAKNDVEMLENMQVGRGDGSCCKGGCCMCSLLCVNQPRY